MTLIRDPQERLDLGSFDLAQRDGRPAGRGWDVEFDTNELSFGASEVVKTVVASLLNDGDNSRINRRGNREVVIPIRFTADDFHALGDAEAAIQRELERRNTLTYLPPRAPAPRTVFDVVTSHMEHVTSAVDQLNIRARYTLHLECLPWTRSATLATQTATPTSVGLTTVDDASSLSAWSAIGNWGGASNPLSLSTDGSETIIIGSRFNMYGRETRVERLQWTGTKPTTPFVAVDVWGGTTITLNGEAPVVVGAITYNGRSYRRLFFVNPGGTAPYDFSITFFNTSYDPGTARVRIANLYSAAGAPTGVQAVASKGSVPSPGSITATRATSMSWLFIYSDPRLQDGFSPRITSTWTEAPDGQYVLWAQRPSGAAAGSTWSVTVTDAAGRAQTLTTRLTAAQASRAWFPLGELTLGGFANGVAGPLSTAATSGLSELRLFRKDPGETTLTYLDGISAKAVTVAAPDLDRPNGAVIADGVVAFDKALPYAFPLITPGTAAVFVEADNFDAAPLTTSLSYYPRWHTLAKED